MPDRSWVRLGSFRFVSCLMLLILEHFVGSFLHSEVCLLRNPLKIILDRMIALYL
jgi:hypothetical protein